MQGRVRALLPAAMQPGSGTVDFLPSLTGWYQQPRWSAGGQLSGAIRWYENDQGYALGDEFRAQGWAGVNALEWLSLSTRLGYHWQGELQGQQRNLNRTPLMGAPPGFTRTVTTAFSENYGGQQVDLGLGANVLFGESMLAGNRFAFEFTLPLYRDRNGIQLETDWVVTAGWQFSW